MKNKACCFIGHREIKITEELKKGIYAYVEHLILNENVKNFLFGSRSEFNVLCHSVVTELKGKYSEIKRIVYTCKSEIAMKESERYKWESIYSLIKGRQIYLLWVEEEFDYKTKYVSGKGAYVERNQAMIDDSDYCVFYYNENYSVPERAKSNAMICCKPKSGTAIAYKYAKLKNKHIKNFYK